MSGDRLDEASIWKELLPAPEPEHNIAWHIAFLIGYASALILVSCAIALLFRITLRKH